jgi:Phosphotransferase enzyme family
VRSGVGIWEAWRSGWWHRRRVDVEHPLSGGNLSEAVVRIGQTVRRPTGLWTPAVHRLLRHLEARGFGGAPRVRGIDDDGREILEFVAGQVPWPGPHRTLLGSTDAVSRVGRLLRRFHDAVATFDPGTDAVWRFPEMAADAEPFTDERGLIVCHNDPAPWNLVVGTDRWAFIDWDTAGPRPPIWDVAYCAVGVVPIGDATHAGWDEPPPVARRFRALADGYDLSMTDRARLADAITARLRSSYEHLRRRADSGIAPWTEMWRTGHGDAWAAMLATAEGPRSRLTKAAFAAIPLLAVIEITMDQANHASVGDSAEARLPAEGRGDSCNPHSRKYRAWVDLDDDRCSVGLDARS